MKVVLQGETELTLQELDREGFDVVSAPHTHAHFSALPMLATSLAMCTGSVLVGWAEQAKLDPEGLALTVSWKVHGRPQRMDDFRLVIHWPRLPESRLKAAVRAAEQCTVHQTLSHPVKVHAEVVAEPAAVHAH